MCVVYFQAISEIKRVCDTAGVDMPAACLSWCSQQPAVSSVIVGARTPEQVEKNAKLITLQQV